MRYVVENEKGYAIAVFMYEHMAEWYIEQLWDLESVKATYKEIQAEDIHDYF